MAMLVSYRPCLLYYFTVFCVRVCPSVRCGDVRGAVVRSHHDVDPVRGSVRDRLPHGSPASRGRPRHIRSLPGSQKPHRELNVTYNHNSPSALVAKCLSPYERCDSLFVTSLQKLNLFQGLFVVITNYKESFYLIYLSCFLIRPKRFKLFLYIHIIL